MAMAWYHHIREENKWQEHRPPVSAISVGSDWGDRCLSAIVLLADHKDLMATYLGQNLGCNVLFNDHGWCSMGSYEKISGQRTKFKSALKANDHKASIGGKADSGIDSVSAIGDMVSGEVPYEALAKILIMHSPLVKTQYFMMFTCSREPREFAQVENQKTIVAREFEKGQELSFAGARTLFAHKVAKKQLGQIREKRDPTLFERIFLSRRHKRHAGIR